MLTRNDKMTIIHAWLAGITVDFGDRDPHKESEDMYYQLEGMFYQHCIDCKIDYYRSGIDISAAGLVVGKE